MTLKNSSDRYMIYDRLLGYITRSLYLDKNQLHKKYIHLLFVLYLFFVKLTIIFLVLKAYEDF